MCDSAVTNLGKKNDNIKIKILKKYVFVCT